MLSCKFYTGLKTVLKLERHRKCAIEEVLLKDIYSCIKVEATKYMIVHKAKVWYFFLRV